MSKKMKLIPPNTLSLFLESCEYEDRNQWFTTGCEVCQLLGYENYDLTKALKKDFIIEIDYIILLGSAQEQDSEGKWGGANKKRFSISSNTVKEIAIRKDKTVRQYYLTLEQLLYIISDI